MTSGRHQPPKPSGERGGRPAVWARIRRTTGTGPRRMSLVVASVCLCGMAAGVSLAAFSSAGDQAGHAAGAGNGSSTDTSHSPQSTPPVASSSTGPNVTSAGIAKTALRYPPDLQGQVVRWAKGRGGTAWSAVTAQLGGVTQVAGARLYSQLRLECATLRLSVQTARNAPPIPYEVMQRSYAKVLAGLAVTSGDCQEAITVRSSGDEDQRITVDKALLNRSLAEFAAESEELYTVTAEIRTLRR